MEETTNGRAFFNRLKEKNQSIFVLYRIRRATKFFEFFTVLRGLMEKFDDPPVPCKILPRPPELRLSESATPPARTVFFIKQYPSARQPV
jgi:hypothetical protein